MTAHIRRIVDKLCLDWPGVMAKRMFGTDAWFAQGHIFALIDRSKQSLGLRLTDEKVYTKARSIAGSGDFDPGGKPMKHWVILPPTFCTNETQVEVYLLRAYEDAKANPPKALKTKGRPMG